MHTLFRSTALLAVLAAAVPAAAEGPLDAAALARQVAPYLDEQTLLVGRVDLARVQVDPLMDRLVQIVPELKGHAEPLHAVLGRVHAGLRQAGFAELFVVVSLADLPDYPLVVAPLGSRGDPDALLVALPELKSPRRDLALKRVGDSLLLGSPRAVARIESQKPDPRPQLAEAFAAAGPAAVQLLLLPTDDDRRVIEEMLPALPAELGGGPSTILTHGIRWAAVAIDLPPEPSLRLAIQSADAESANVLGHKWEAVLAPLSQPAAPGQPPRLTPEVVAALRPRVEGDRLLLSLDRNSPVGEPLLAGLKRPVSEAIFRAWRARSIDNLKRIGLAMLNYHDARKSFPAQGSYDAAGKPLLSWRVLILPYVEENALYREFRLDEPWDSPHNAKLIERMPAVYRSPAAVPLAPGHTVYLRPVGPGTACPGAQAISFRDLIDGTSNTLLVVEADTQRAVPWTKPDDLPFDPKDPARGLGGLFPGRFNLLMADGSATTFNARGKPEQLRRLMTRNDREVFDWRELRVP